MYNMKSRNANAIVKSYKKCFIITSLNNSLVKVYLKFQDEQ